MGAEVACDNRRVNAPATTPRGAHPYLLLTLAPLFWACNWIVGRGLASDIPPMAMTFFRWLFALVILAPFAWPHVRRDWPLVDANWKTMLVLGAIGVGTHNALAYLGLNYTTATNGVILNSFIPVMIIAISWMFLRERLSAVQLAGVGVSLAGVLTILSRGSLDVLTSFRLNRRRPVRDPVDGDVVGLHDRPALASRRSAHADVPVRPDRCRPLCVLPFFVAEFAFGRRMVVTATNIAALVGDRALLVGARLHLLESRRRAGRRERGRTFRPPDAGVRRRARLDLPGRAARPVPCRRNCAYPDGHRDHEPAGAASGAGTGRNGLTVSARRIAPRAMTDIGNADRVDLMQRLVALQIEHRDLDDVIRRLADDPGTTSCSSPG